MLNARFAGHQFPPHAHESFTVALVTGGSYLVRAAGKVFVATRGDVIFLNPGEVHSGAPGAPNGWAMRSMHLDVDFIRAYIAQEFGLTNFRFTRQFWTKDPILTKCLFRFHRSAEAGQVFRKLDALFRKTMAHFVENYSDAYERKLTSENKVCRYISKAKIFMRDNFDAKILLDDIAAPTGLSKFYFLKLFSETEGITPHAWLTQQRIQRAVDLLQDSDPSRLSELAIDVGFSDQAHFTREFKKIIGLTPHVFRATRAQF